MSVKHTYITDTAQLKVEALEADNIFILRRTHYGPENIQVNWIEFDNADEEQLLQILAERAAKRGGNGNVAIH